MTAASVQIAKTAFLASLFKADPTSLGRAQIDTFFPLLQSMISVCSRSNVQKCKNWIIENVVFSQTRVATLGRYLVALSNSLEAGTGTGTGKKPSVKRKRLHLLYLVNDVLSCLLRNDRPGQSCSSWQPSLPGLVASAAAFDKCPKHKKKLESLLTLWGEKGYFPPAAAESLREALSGTISAVVPVSDGPGQSLKLAKDKPFILPAFHGDSRTPWHDLPAATWLSSMTPNSAKPMSKASIRPVQLVQGPAPQAMADAVHNLIKDAERMFSKSKNHDDDPLADLSELGERVYLDEITGEIVDGDTYYGWSRKFCKSMKDRVKKTTMSSKRRSGRSRSRSLSRSHSLSRSRSRSHSPYSRRSRSYSPPVSKRRRYSSSRSRSRSSSRSRRRSDSPNKNRRRSRSYSRSPRRASKRSRSRSSSPRLDQQADNAAVHSAPPPPPPPAPPSMSSHLVQGLPIPPPPPPNYNGPWPPPPPPLVGGNHQPWLADPSAMAQMIGNLQTTGPVPPPPPPPGMFQQSWGQHEQPTQSQGWNQAYNYPSSGFQQGPSVHDNGGNAYRGGRGRGRGNHDRAKGW